MFNKKNHVGRPSNDELKKKKIIKICAFLVPIVIIVGGIFLLTHGNLSKIMGNSVSGKLYCDEGYVLENNKCVKEIVEDAYFLGDVNLDGKITVEDADLVYKYIGAVEYDEVKDFPITDYQLKLADVNLDGTVYYVDVDILRGIVNDNPGTYKSYQEGIGVNKICKDGYDLKNDKCIKKEIVDAKSVDQNIGTLSNNPVEVTFIPENKKNEIEYNKQYRLNVKFDIKDKNSSYYYIWRDYSYGENNYSTKCTRVAQGEHDGAFIMDGTKKIRVTIYSDSNCTKEIKTADSKEYACVGCDNTVDMKLIPENEKIVVKRNTNYNFILSFDVKDKKNDYYYIWRNYLNGSNTYSTNCTKVVSGDHGGSFKIDGYRRAEITLYSDSSCKNKIKSISSKLYMYEAIISGKRVALKSRLSFDSKNGLQGICLTDKYIVAAKLSGTDSKRRQLSSIYIIGKDDFKIKKEIKNNLLGHANDCTYNPNTKEVTFVTSEGEKTPAIKRFKINNNYTITNTAEFHKYKSQLYMNDKPVNGNTFKNLPAISSLAYDYDHNQYIVYAGKQIYITNMNYEVKKSFSVQSYLIAQGIAYYKDKIYVTLFESGSDKQQNHATPSEAGSNVVYIYDLNGNFENALYIPKSQLMPNDKVSNNLPEMESMDFYSDGTMLFGYTKHYGGSPRSINFYTGQ